jgi:hypothetical protein
MYNSRAIGIAAIVALCQASVAFWIAPRSCDGGLEFYAAVGVGALVVMASLPFVLRSGETTTGRFGWAFVFVLMSVVAWAGGLFAADVRLLCRLF